ncbi:MAG TPA: hypothetical protein VH866_01255 [Candidatus Deferrimicrobiaceae bacterium]
MDSSGKCVESACPGPLPRSISEPEACPGHACADVWGSSGGDSVSVPHSGGSGGGVSKALSSVAVVLAAAALLMNFVIPGPAGPAGPAGANGTNGTNGTDGTDGVAGPEGPQGPVGPEGPAGPTGATGPAGPQGPAGPGALIFYGVKGDPNNPASEYIDTTCGWHFYVQVNAPGPGIVTLTGTAVVTMLTTNGPAYVFLQMTFLGDCSSYPVTASEEHCCTDFRLTIAMTNAITLPAAGTYFIYLNAWSSYPNANTGNYFEWGVMIATFYPS